MTATETPPQFPDDVSRVEHANRWRANPWLVAVVALVAALLGVGAWAIVDRSDNDVAQPGAPDDATVELIDQLTASTDGETYASFFTEDGVLVEYTRGGMVTKGRDNIARHMQQYFDMGWNSTRVGAVVQWDNFAAHALRGPNPLSRDPAMPAFHGMLIYELTDSGQISQVWVYGDYMN